MFKYLCFISYLYCKGKSKFQFNNASNTEDQNFLMSFTITFVFTDITVLFLTAVESKFKKDFGSDQNLS